VVTFREKDISDPTTNHSHRVNLMSRLQTFQTWHQPLQLRQPLHRKYIRKFKPKGRKTFPYYCARPAQVGRAQTQVLVVLAKPNVYQGHRGVSTGQARSQTNSHSCHPSLVYLLLIARSVAKPGVVAKHMDSDQSQRHLSRTKGNHSGLLGGHAK
jgi:hypothetical protein